MTDAGKYCFRLKRQTPIPSNEGITGYRDSGETWWASIEDTKSSEDDDNGSAIFATMVVIKIRNAVSIGANDRLIDTETDEIYNTLGVQRNIKNNETIVLGERRIFGNVV